MTTLFAIIISALLFWPKEQEEIPNFKNQISKTPKTITISNVEKETIQNKEFENTGVPIKNQDSIVNQKPKVEEIQSFIPNNCSLIDKSKSYSWFEIELSQSENKYLKIYTRCREFDTINNGEYTFSNANPNYQSTMSFSGELYLDNNKIRILGGSFFVRNSDSKSINLIYNFNLENNQVIKGEYNGKANLTLPYDKLKATIDSIYKNVKPINGERFILKLTNEEYEKLGLFITDSSFRYNNKVNNFRYEYEKVRTRFYYDDDFEGRSYVDENGKKYEYKLDEKSLKRKETDGSELLILTFILNMLQIYIINY